MKTFWLALIFILNPLYGNEVPVKWKNNPRLHMVYTVKKETPATEYHPHPIPVGTKVVISVRSVTDIFDREDKKEGLRLLIVGTKNDEDPGICDGAIPLNTIDEYLTETEEVAPLTHWRKSHDQYADKDIPNLKPNHYFTQSFVVNAYLAADYETERPRFVAMGIYARIIKPSIHCKEDEITLRLEKESEESTYPERLKKLNPDNVLVNIAYGSDYCVSYRDFLYEFYPHREIKEKLPDSVTWDEVAKRYQHNFSLNEMEAAAVRINPYTEKEIAAGRMSALINVFPAKDFKGLDPNEVPPGAWVAEYAGSLYYACANGICRAQGYQVLIDNKGELVKFIKNHLYSWDGSNELLLDENDSIRLTKLSNSRTDLEELYGIAKNNFGNAYTAAMSARSAAASLGRRAGNSYGTFLIHMSKIREALHLQKLWPIYDGKSPE